MKRQMWRRWAAAAVLAALFLMFTALVAHIDVRPIGPGGSGVGLAGINGAVFRALGVHPGWYHLTEWLGLVPLATAGTFGALGAYRLLLGRSIRKVGVVLPTLGGCYILLAACYLLFETVVINCRPVLTDGILEVSYPSSHTMMVVCIMATAAITVRELWPQRRRLHRAADAVCALVAGMVTVGRLLAGVHWLTDIVGALLLSAALIALYCAALGQIRENREG